MTSFSFKKSDTTKLKASECSRTLSLSSALQVRLTSKTLFFFSHHLSSYHWNVSNKWVGYRIFWWKAWSKKFNCRSIIICRQSQIKPILNDLPYIRVLLHSSRKLLWHKFFHLESLNINNTLWIACLLFLSHTVNGSTLMSDNPIFVENMYSVYVIISWVRSSFSLLII